MSRRKKIRQGSVRQTFGLLRQATTPAIYIRSLKTFRQAGAGGAAGTGALTVIQQLIDPNATNALAATTGRTGALVALLGAVFAWLWSLGENILAAAEKLVNDVPPADPPTGAPAAGDPPTVTVQVVPETIQVPLGVEAEVATEPAVPLQVPEPPVVAYPIPRGEPEAP